MKKLLYAVLIILQAGCIEKPKDDQAKQQDASERALENFSQSDKSGNLETLNGYYINTKYIERLKRTKSTMESQNVSPLSMVEIARTDEGNLFRTGWSFHEGGEEGIFKITGQGRAVVLGGNGEKLFDIELRPNSTISVKGEKESYELVKCCNNATDFEAVASSVVNSTLFAGEYRLGSRTVKFKEDGKITGIDSLDSYQVATDYIDVAMSFDKIYFKAKGKKYLGYGDEYGYAFRNDTLEIFRVACKTYAEDDPETCVEDAKGKPAYTLVKK